MGDSAHSTSWTPDRSSPTRASRDAWAQCIGRTGDLAQLPRRNATRAQLSKEAPDVAVLDLGLPDSGAGLDVLRELVSIYVLTRAAKESIACAASRAPTTTSSSAATEPRFLGHVGGDDFVLLVGRESAEQIASEVAIRFDSAVPHLYADEDLKAGQLQTIDRTGAPVKNRS